MENLVIATYIPDIITTIVALSVGGMVWMLKRSITTFSKNQSEQTTVLNNLKTENEVANANYKNFQIHCKETTKVTFAKLNSHEKDIKNITLKQAKQSVTIEDHDRRIGVIERK